jgi:Predicted archaeal kinase (sugar kinase superfamily)
MGKYKIYTPAGLSSFFEACIFNEKGNIIEDPSIKGARGGGFTLEKGTITTTTIDENNKEVEVYINGKKENAVTTKNAVKLLLNFLNKKDIGVKVYHKISLPIGAGFGTSASGALGAILSLSYELGHPISIINAIRLSHIADVLSYTGLETAEGFATGGVVLITEPGTFWNAEVEKIAYSRDILIVAAYFEPIKKESILKSIDALVELNKVAKETMKNVLKYPTVDNLLKESRIFAEKSGIGDKEMLKISDELVKNGAIGATQNMIGRAVHCAVYKKTLSKIVDLLKQYTENVYVSKIHDGGPLIYSYYQ